MKAVMSWMVLGVQSQGTDEENCQQKLTEIPLSSQYLARDLIQMFEQSITTQQ